MPVNTPYHLAAPARLNRRPHLFIDVQHGLANRLRAMASGAAIAQATGRQLVVIWRPDAHCEARMGDLFTYPGPVIEQDPAGVLRSTVFQAYNYMEIEDGAQFQEPILPGDDPGGDLYIRSAYTLSSRHCGDAVERRFLRGLHLADPVLELLAPFAGRVPWVTAHIRMATGAEFDHLEWEGPENWPAHRHQEMTEWRRKSHVARFIPRLDALVEAGRAESIFVAADLPETYEILRARYPQQFICLPRQGYDRSSQQVQYAMADLILLARGRHFLASTWSAFSDLAQRLAPMGRPVERSGIEF